MQCPRCQARNRQWRRFCAECSAPSAFPCASCGFSNEPGEKYCGGCGLALTPADRTPDSTSHAFHTYTPSYLVDKILPLKRALEGGRRQVTVLFADYRPSYPAGTRNTVRVASNSSPIIWRNQTGHFGLLGEVWKSSNHT